MFLTDTAKQRRRRSGQPTTTGEGVGEASTSGHGRGTSDGGDFFSLPSCVLQDYQFRSQEHCQHGEHGHDALMESHPERVEQTHPSGSKPRLWPWVVAVTLLLCAWVGYKWWQIPSALLQLPDGTAVMFRGVTEGKKEAYWDGRPSYEHTLADGRGSFLRSVHNQLPRFIARHIPKPAEGPSMKTSFSTQKALWFSFKGHLWHRDTDYLWVDEHGYETATTPVIFNEKDSVMAFEGNVPWGSPHLHLRIRAREKWSEDALGTSKAGAILGETKIPNSLRAPLSAHTASPFPIDASAPIYGQTIRLTSARRARVVNETNRGFVFQFQLPNGTPASSRFRVDPSILADGAGNRLAVKRVHEGPLGLYADAALWKDNPVWTLSTAVWRLQEQDFQPQEKLHMPGIPIPTSTGGTIAWNYEVTCMGYQLRFTDVSLHENNLVTITLEASPEMTDHRILLLKALSDSEEGLVELKLERMHRAPLKFRQGGPAKGKATIWLPLPKQGRSMEAVFGIDTATRLDFTFRPEFEP